MPIYKWSTTAASNGDSDPTINYQEGQAPGSINDSARAAMAVLAGWRQDISGALITTGSSTAFALTSNEDFDTLADMNGAMIAFVPNTTCGATVTLNVDGLGTKPLRTSPGVELPAGLLIQGTPYVATYNNTDGAFYLQGFYSLPYAIPVGGLLPYVGATAPNSSFVLPMGQAISRTTYATLFSLIGTTFGIGDGSTTFNVPSAGEKTLVGLASAKSLITGYDCTVIGSTIGEGQHTLAVTEAPTGLHTLHFNDPGHTHAIGQPGGAAVFAALAPTSPGDNLFPTISNTTGITASLTDNAGGGAHNNVQPGLVVNFILRVI